MKNFKKFKNMLAIAGCIGLILLGFFSARLFQKGGKKEELDAKAISAQISSCSELASAKLSYRGIVNYTDGSIPLFDKKSFSMIYTATIKAGYDLKKAQVDVTKDTITIQLPDVKILYVEVDPNSLSFYDQEYALFNWTKKEDTATAIQFAKKDALKKAKETDLTKEATKQTKTLITSLLSLLHTGKGEPYHIVFQ